MHIYIFLSISLLVNEHMAAVLCWPTTPLRWACSGVWVIYPETLCWRKTDSPFPRKYQLLITPLLGVVLRVYFPCSYLGPVWFTLRRSCRCCHSRCESICVSCCVQRTPFPWSHPWPLALSSLFTSSS